MNFIQISTNIMLFIFYIGLISMVGYISFMLVKNEMAKKKWSPTMKVGDDVNFSTLSNSVNAVITDLNPTDDESIVEVTVLVDKGSLYPGRVRDIDGTIL